MTVTSQGSVTAPKLESVIAELFEATIKDDVVRFERLATGGWINCNLREQNNETRSN